METIQQEIKLSDRATKLSRYVTNPFLLKMYMFKNLPMGIFAGLKVKKLNTKMCQVTVPYGWRTRNPFKSTYFAALSMAAEMSLGALVLLAVEHSGKKISTLIVGMESEFIKKATSRTTFTCLDGLAIFDAVERASQSSEPVEIYAETVGISEEGIEVAKFRLKWSFKKKS